MTTITDYTIRWRINHAPNCTIWLRFEDGAHYFEPASAAEALAYAAVLRDPRTSFWDADARSITTGAPMDDGAGFSQEETEYVESYDASWSPKGGWVRVNSHRAPDHAGGRERVHDTLRFDDPAAFAVAMEALQRGAIHFFIRSENAISGLPLARGA